MAEVARMAGYALLAGAAGKSLAQRHGFFLAGSALIGLGVFTVFSGIRPTRRIG